MSFLQKPFLLSILFLFFTRFAFGQPSFDNWLKVKESFRIEPFVMFQLWNTYSIDHQVYNDQSGHYEKVDDRFNVLLRRARLGFRMEPYEGLRFVLMGAYDMIGRDVLTGLLGPSNNGSLPEFGIWDAFGQWQIKKGSEAFYLTGGYFRPQFSRESITSGWATTSMEKSMSQNYIRTHLVGFGPGRAMGLNFGGLLQGEEKKLGLIYNFGIFNPVYNANNGNSVGDTFAPLLAGRLAFQLGDPEMTSYGVNYQINYFGQRKGLSIGWSGAYQGATNLFESSYATEVDFLFNWGPVNIDGDWNFMWRSGSRPENGGTREFTYASNTGHFRAGVNVVAGKKFFLEPTFMVMQFNGATDALEQADAKAIGAFSGREYTYDAGINWYLDRRKLKVLLHYTWRNGDAGDAGDGATVNLYFQQSGSGAIRRGNWIGLGVHAVF